MKQITTLIVTLLILTACTQVPTPDTGNNPRDKPTVVKVDATYTPPQPFDPNEEFQPKAFASEEELAAFVSGQGSSGGGIYYNSFARGGATISAVAESGAMDATAAKAVPAPDGFSTTNNQVAGVDEADIIKTDGKNVYTISGNTLFIVSAGKDAKLIKSINFKQQPQGMFLEGDKLAVFGYYYDLDYFKSIDYIPRNSMTFFTVYDISNPSDPKVVKEYRFEGSYFQARMTNGYVYLAVQSSPSADHPRPLIAEGEKTSFVPVDRIYRYPVPYNSIQYISIHAMKLSDASEAESISMAVEYENQLYMSENNIYITSVERVNEWEITQDVMMELLESELTDKDKELIEKIKQTDDQVLNQNEKRSKIIEVYNYYLQYMDDKKREDLQDKIQEETSKRMEKYDALVYTVVNRVSADDGKLKMEATGKVPGTLLNQFSMDEYDNVFRIATTIDPWGRWIRPMPIDARADAVSEKMGAPIYEREKSTNNVYTMDMDMKVIGKLENLAEDERIYSTRFMGDRLYMVTFKQVDPFFAIDLSDPKNPEVLGKLKIPGFSRYLHPYDDNIIIGIGRDATSTGRQQGLKISLFDVTDVENPKEIAKWVADERYASSTAEYEHKAFLFDREKELLVIPAYNYAYRGSGLDYTQSYNGAMVFKINKEDIEMRGIIDHSKGQEYGPQVERSLWIGDLLYTKSPSLLRINEISTLETVKSIDLKYSGSGPYPMY